MNDDTSPDPLRDLPEHLAELDEELRDLNIAERPSFGPELHAELERMWVQGGAAWSEAGRAHALRRVAAAAAVAVLFVSLSVPPARASLAELSRQALRSFGVLEDPSPPPAPGDSGLLASGPPEEPGPVRGTDGWVAGDREGGNADPDVEEPPAFTGIPATLPELADRAAEEEAIRRHYPEELQRKGVGGIVRFQLWVDSAGRVDNVNMSEGSGEPNLNRAALRAVKDLRFRPATRGGVPVGTWVEFDLVFEPRADDAELPTVQPVEEPGAPPGLGGAGFDRWSPEAVISPPVGVEARELLRAAFQDRPEILGRLGSAESLLRGTPPAGVSPLGWRADAMDALERAMARDPDNPATYLALGRILNKQGLEGEALRLFERGIERAGRRVRPASPELVADLHYERGMVLKEAWLAWSSLGEVEIRGGEGPRCVRSESTGDPASADALIALNFLCPSELERIVSSSFSPVETGTDHRGEMLRAFRTAVEADPAHVDANIEILLDVASSERWYELLDGARRFAWASRGHPHALLLSGLALQRLGRVEEAREELEAAFRNLPDDHIAALRDIRPLLTEEEVERLDRMDDPERRRAVGAFWGRLDPILATEVNEREVEHLARAAHALLRLGGVETDAGGLWVRYGAPERVRVVGRGSDLRTEFWDYGRAPYVTFRRPAMSEALELTPEARAYLDDLRRVFPHWYGNRARRVFTLPAEMARFRAADGGSEVEIRTRVPPELRGESGEALELGLYTLGRDGEILTDTVQTLRGRDIRVRAPAPAGAVRVVLEIYNAEEGEAASVRTTVPRGTVGEEDPGISDLLLVGGATPPDRDVTRRDREIDPLEAGPVSADRVGLLFELYRLSESDEPYTIRVEAVPSDGGTPLTVPFRPAGQTLFGPAWSHRPLRRNGVVTEHLTLDLASVPPGSYTLRVSVDLPGELTTAVSTRVLHRADGGDG